MELQTYLVFLITSAIVILSPGPSTILVATQSANNGWKASQAGILGLVVATSLYFVLTATGLASVILASHVLFQVIKWTGVCFLIYLGISAILGKSSGLNVTKSREPQRALTLFTQGFIIELANPKALIYFAAILPQFIDVNESIAMQLFTMGATGAVLQMVIYSLYALLGDRIANGGIKSTVVNMINRIAGAALVLAGVRMAISEQDHR